MDSFSLGVLRVRAQVEAERELLGGLSLRARELPFQTRSVAAILAADRIRHLIADEVGFGKTVQAMMVAAAVLRRDPDRQVFILCPNHLARQWAEELLSRFHESAGYATWLWHGGSSALGGTPGDVLQCAVRKIEGELGAADGGLSDPAVSACLLDGENLRQAPRPTVVAALTQRTRTLRIYLATPGLLQGGWTIPEPQCGRLVIVDEWHALNAVQRDNVQRMLLDSDTDALLLTATPPLGALRDAYLRLLVPEAETAEAARPYVLRNTRADFQDLFPTRSARLVVVEPSDVEREAETATMRTFREQRTDGGVPDYAAFARGLRSEASRHGGLTLAADRAPDARVDWTLDMLAEYWLRYPDEAVAIAVGDNPTIDLVSRRLSATFRAPAPDGAAALIASDPLPSVAVYALRQGAEATDAARQARGFAMGNGARVLLLAGEANDAAYAGLNLQAAGRLIVLSLPADPIMLEQLIGRFDRLGSRLAGAPLPIDVVVRKGSVLADLYRYHEALGVFRAPYAFSDPSRPDGGNDGGNDQNRLDRIRAIWDQLLGDSGERTAWIEKTKAQTEQPQPIAAPDVPPGGRWAPHERSRSPSFLHARRCSRTGTSTTASARASRGSSAWQPEAATS